MVTLAQVCGFLLLYILFALATLLIFQLLRARDAEVSVKNNRISSTRYN